MASKRIKGKGWEFTVKRAGLLEKPLILTFYDETEGDQYCKNLEALLDRGIIPDQFQLRPTITNLDGLIKVYLRDAQLSVADRETLRTFSETVLAAPLTNINVDWVDGWVQDMKRVDHYRPATIRKKVGALARCCDWGIRKKMLILPDTPFRTLPEGYANYTELDGKLAGGIMTDTERDRRFEPGEENRIREVLDKGILSRKQRPYEILHKQEVIVLFGILLETAMRLREVYTLTGDQIDLKGRTVNLDKTKNGDRRQVPLSSVAIRLLTPYAGCQGNLFPWLGEQKGNLKLTTNYLSKLFAQVFEEANCPDLHTHDLRHEAISRMFERTALSVEEIMKLSGHRTHKMMMRYLKLRASTLASKLW